MSNHEKIDYVEFPSTDIGVTKAFFAQVFGWVFTDYGPEYCAFTNAGLEGGFFLSDKTVSTCNGSALIVFYRMIWSKLSLVFYLLAAPSLRRSFPFPVVGAFILRIQTAMSTLFGQLRAQTSFELVF